MTVTFVFVFLPFFPRQQEELINQTMDKCALKTHPVHGLLFYLLTRKLNCHLRPFHIP